MTANLKLIHTPIRVAPDTATLSRIPLARHGEYDLSEREIKSTRKLIYGINKDGIRRYRTMLDGGILMVWRIK